MRQAANYQDFIKLVAIVAMIVDHVGLYFLPEIPVLRLVGRTAMPIFCFFAGYNYKGKIRYEVLLYGVLAYCITILIHHQFIEANILISIFIGYIYLYFFHNQLKTFNTGYFHVVILGCLWMFTKDFFDYGSLAIVMMVLGVIAKNDVKSFKLSILIAQILSIFHTVTAFEPNNLNLLLVIILGSGSYFLMIAQNLKTQISFNFNFLTRNLLFVFFLQLAIIEISWLIYHKFWE